MNSDSDNDFEQSNEEVEDIGSDAEEEEVDFHSNTEKEVDSHSNAEESIEENDSHSDAEVSNAESNRDNSDDSKEEPEASDDGDIVGSNAGWANSIAKILKTSKAKGKSTLVLSKAKKLTDLNQKIKKEVEAGFEVECKDGKIKRELIEESDSDESDQPLRKKRRDLPSARVKPNILEKDRERKLLKIATKGVVQLFNAVKKQQRDIDTKLTEAGPVDAKREKVLKNLDKNEFLNVLMGDQNSNVTDVNTKQEKSIKEESKNKVTWNVLRDDFNMDAQMRDWDKSSEDEEEDEENNIEV